MKAIFDTTHEVRNELFQNGDKNGTVFTEKFTAGTVGWLRISGPEKPITHLVYVCPCGCKAVSSIPIVRPGNTGEGWEWDGNEVLPTLKPSIFRHISCGWHGFLRKGEWVNA